jgi:hypothetical protein
MAKRDEGTKLTAWRRCLLASTLLSTMCLLPAGAAVAADFLPGKVPVRVGADSSELCTFWTGLGSEEYFFVADMDGEPLPVNAWLRHADPNELVNLFETLYGFAWITSKPGVDWLASPAGQAWLGSEPGATWRRAMTRTATTSTTGAPPMEYVKICSLYGAGFYYIPGADTCVNVGGYIRSPIATYGEPKDYGDLRSYLNNQFTQMAGYTFGKPNTNFEWSDWQPTYRVSRSFGGEGPPATQSRSPSSTETPARISRSFGDGPSGPRNGDDSFKNFAEIMSGKGISGVPSQSTPDAPSPTTQAKGPIADKGGAKAPPPAKGGKGQETQAKGGKAPDAQAKGGKAKDAQPVEEGVKIHFKVNQAMLDKSEVGPALVGQHVQIFPEVEPDHPSTEKQRTAELENKGANQDPPRCVTNANGTCTTTVAAGAEEEYGFPEYKVGLRFNLEYKKDQPTQTDYNFKTDWQLGGSYTARLQLRNYDSWVAETNPQQPKPDFSQLNSDGLTFRANWFNVGGMEYVQLDSISLGGNGKTREQIPEIVKSYLDKLNQLGVKYTFEGNICRLELPGPWVDDAKSGTQRGGGIPTAAISLRTDRPRRASR